MDVKGFIRNYKENVKNVNWEKKLIFIHNSDFYIFYTEYNNKKLIKPYCKYENIYFEQLFGFTYECSDYTPERIVDITDAIN